MISFIILTMNSENFIKKCVDSVMNQCQKEKLVFELVVSDNGSSDDTLRILEEYQVANQEIFRIITFETNRGTTISRNCALKQARGSYFCILDSDTHTFAGRIKEICCYLESHKEIGLIAPKLFLPSMEVQNSIKKFPTLFQKMSKIIGILSKKKVSNNDCYLDFPFDDIRYVETAISACWFFRRDLLDIVGFLDENIFYAPEDIDYCARIWKKDLGIIYYPFLSVIHETQQITHKRPFSAISLSHLKGLMYYYFKHGGWVSTAHINKIVDSFINKFRIDRDKSKVFNVL